jgi:hypothetical protein
MQLGGYTNRVAWIDLTDGTVEYRPIADEDARKYIGARGLGVKYVYDNGPTVDALSPDNLLCFMNGPLTGTDVNLSGRLAVVTKSPSPAPSPIRTWVAGPRRGSSGPGSMGLCLRARRKLRSMRSWKTAW